MILETLDDDKLLQQAIDVAIEYRRRCNKNLGITSEVGEYKACKLLKLDRAKGNINEGFDAEDTQGKRVQIKSRICLRGSERTGIFSSFNFDYALLVLLDSSYEVFEIYKADRKTVEDEIKNQSYKRNSISVSRFKKLGEQVPVNAER
ncbi:DUF6998 domain-containing protein [Chloroflexota bacterium]